MMARSDRIQGKVLCDVPVKLAYESTIKSTAKGSRVLYCMKDNGLSKINPSVTLVTSDSLLIFLSVPDLTSKTIATFSCLCENFYLT